jgi:hypothetical protein
MINLNEIGIDTTEINVNILNEIINNKFFILYFILIVISIIIIYIASKDYTTLTSKTYTYGFLIIVPLIIGILLVSPLISGTKNINILLYIAIFSIIIIIIFYFYLKTSTLTIFLTSYIINIILLLILIIGLAIFYKMFDDYLKSFSGWTEFFINFIFYIPCLTSDIIEFIINQYKITPNIIIVLFIIEILFIIMYIYVPPILTKIIQKDANVLLYNPIFLNNEKMLNTNSNLFTMSYVNNNILKLHSSNDDNIFRTNYSISFWSYINNENISLHAEKEIFNYGGGKPRITYTNIPNSINNKYTVYYSNIGNSSYNMELENQKWNYFVITYNNNIVDIFINGVLKQSIEITNNIPTYSLSDTITVGENNGLYGAICNVNYYLTPLTKSQIANSYNLLQFSNPPII